jgi:molybdenum cofactor cytidylyltransferase
MKFAEIPLEHAEGAVLAHSQRLGPGEMLKKGRTLSAGDCRALATAGVFQVVAVRLDEGDVDENSAARRVAEAAAGANVEIGPATTGRANLFAKLRGVLVLSRTHVDDVNLVDEAITIATIAPFAVVEAGTMVATVKIIPFAVPAELLSRVCERARRHVPGSAGAWSIPRRHVPGSAGAWSIPDDHSPLVAVAPLVRKRAGLVLTTLPGTRPEQLVLAAKSQHQRLAYLGGEIARELTVAHDTPSISLAIDALLREGLDLVLVMGASAIVDRRDVIPRAIEAIGGTVDHLGMPVDPGNLLLLGHKAHVPIVGVPGCARSLKPSGFDWVLERLAADLPIAREDIMRLGTGGLLADVSGRPSPRKAPGTPHAAPPCVAAIVLAAGSSRRMGGTNKLLTTVDGVPMVARVVDALLASKAARVLVVLGHQADRVRAALEGRPVRFVDNEAHQEGLGASLRVGIEALDEDVDAALVALGDMPWIRPEHVNRIIDAFDPKGDRTICVPVCDRKRGHPVLWSARHFGEMRKLGGDIGGRGLLERHADSVLAVSIDDTAILLDVDTPDMLADAEKLRHGRY